MQVFVGEFTWSTVISVWPPSDKCLTNSALSFPLEDLTKSKKIPIIVYQCFMRNLSLINYGALEAFESIAGN